MSGPIRLVKKGESLPFVFDRDGESVSGWICTIYVKQFKADTAAITRVIALDADDQWSGYLTATETESLTAPTLYRIIAKLTHADNVEEEQVPIRFQLNEAWA